MSSLSFFIRTFLFAGLILLAGIAAHAQPPEIETPSLIRGTLEEIRDKQRAYLMVISSIVLDAREPDRGVVEAVRQREVPSRRLRRVYPDIARRLNKYIRKYKSMTASDNADTADFLIVFNVLRYHRLLSVTYPAGEMYVIVDRPNEPVRILWKTEKEMIAEDATKRLVDALKKFRRER